jgi:S-adenosylmethionine uptake transporter
MSDAAKGAGYMVLSGVIFACMWVVIRYASDTMNPALIVFYRNLFGFLTLIPFYYSHGFSGFATERFPLHMVRAVGMLVGTYSIFFAISVTPLATVVAVTYAAPIFAAVGAIWILKEKIHLRRVMAIVIGFVGVMVVIRPAGLDLTLGIDASLIGALAMAMSLIVVKMLSKTEKPQTIVAYAYVLILPVSFIVALFYWRPITWEEAGLMATLGVGVTYGQLFLVKAFQKADVMAVLPLDFIRFLLASFFGIWLFSEPVDIWVWIGAIIILGSTVYTAHREALAHKKAKMQATVTPL